MKRRQMIFVLIGMLGILFLAACGNRVSNKSDKIQAFTTIYPLEYFTKSIGGPNVEVTNIIPAGTEPHDFELSPRMMAKITKADLLVYNGAGLEGWIEKVTQNLKSDKPYVVNTSQGIHLLKGDTLHHHEHSHSQLDPHLWLDPVIALKQASRIKEALIKIDEKNEKMYTRNFNQLSQKLQKLHKEYVVMVKDSTKKEFVTSHAAFGYLAHRYGLKQIPISGLSPLDEPSPKELQKIIHTMDEHGLKYIYFETLVNTKIAEVIRRETNAEVLTLNPLEGLTKKEVAEGADYFSIMRKNKDHLARGLGVH